MIYPGLTFHRGLAGKASGLRAIYPVPFPSLLFCHPNCHARILPSLLPNDRYNRTEQCYGKQPWKVRITEYADTTVFLCPVYSTRLPSFKNHWEGTAREDNIVLSVLGVGNWFSRVLMAVTTNKSRLCELQRRTQWKQQARMDELQQEQDCM